MISDSGKYVVVINDKNKEAKRLLLTEWDRKKVYYEKLYGEITPAPKKAIKASPRQVPVMLMKQTTFPLLPVWQQKKDEC